MDAWRESAQSKNFAPLCQIKKRGRRKTLESVKKEEEIAQRSGILCVFFFFDASKSVFLALNLHFVYPSLEGKKNKHEE